MQKIRTLIVDDEPLARRRINSLLQKRSDVEIIGECKNGREAQERIKNFRPDLVFMDIQMPDVTGIEVVEKSDVVGSPFYIFVTAFDQYALRAFDVQAVDYLLKPYDEDRFTKALEHAKTRITEKSESTRHRQLQQIADNHRRPNASGPGVIEVSHRGRNFAIKTDEIHWIEADGNYLRLHVEDTKYLIRQTMQSMCAMLNSEIFLRIHRSLIVNALFMEDARYEGNNQYAFRMKSGKVLLSGRSFKESVKQFLEEI